LELKHIYKYHTFHSLKSEAFGKNFNGYNFRNYKTMLGRKWIVTESISYFKFIIDLMNVEFELDKVPYQSDNNLMALMLYYDFYQDVVEDLTLEEGLKQIGKNKELID